MAKLIENFEDQIDKIAEEIGKKLEYIGIDINKVIWRKIGFEKCNFEFFGCGVKEKIIGVKTSSYKGEHDKEGMDAFENFLRENDILHDREDYRLLYMYGEEFIDLFVKELKTEGEAI